MRNEEAIKYDAPQEQQPAITQPLVNARIMLTGTQAPATHITNRNELAKYCTELLGQAAVEEFHVICVSARCDVLAETCISRGDLSEVATYPRTIAAAALLSNAQSVFLTHNHPGGTANPSAEDLRSTMQIKQALNLFGIHVLDHLIVTPYGTSYSMRARGDL